MMVGGRVRWAFSGPIRWQFVVRGIFELARVSSGQRPGFTVNPDRPDSTIASSTLNTRRPADAVTAGGRHSVIERANSSNSGTSIMEILSRRTDGRMIVGSR